MSALQPKQTYADKDGHFRRTDSSFRSTISPDPSSPFPAEPNRYVLYIHRGCPWAHRANIVRSLKGLEDIIQLVTFDHSEKEGSKVLWCFKGDQREPLYGFKYLKDVYQKAEPGYEGRYTVPMLWDTKTEKVVNNESSEIIRIFYTAFDTYLPTSLRETSKPLYPAHLRADIDEMNGWVYQLINNGVYKAGFATTQAAYDANVYPLFEALDRVERHLADAPYGGPFLFGENITEADIRLFPTIVRFDVAYFTLFRCNLRMVRGGYPRIERWLRELYWDDGERTNGGAFRNTTNFDAIKLGYANSQNLVVPAGPVPNVRPLDD
ncbi:glutathione transferase [Periconia macrospinosa]|uniref:Glutathione transferase n=1 Tax=Periconia macrospinosa TaxID=97972 RepID=A0A2V1DRA2_9PLEO|nr:glutathione transferase [Periconia macrospinosa]